MGKTFRITFGILLIFGLVLTFSSQGFAGPGDELNFSAYAVGEQYVSVPYSNKVRLEVISTKDDCVYQWKNRPDMQNSGPSAFQDIEGATNSYYIIETVERYMEFRCYVSNNTGVDYVFFTVSVDNGFYATAGSNVEWNILPGESITLCVDADCNEGDLTYEWYSSSGGPGGTLLESSDDNVHSIENAVQSRTYWCNVSDQYDNHESVYFYVHVTNQFSVTAGCDQLMEVEYGTTHILSVDVICSDGEPDFEWYYYNRNHGPGQYGGFEIINDQNNSSFKTGQITKDEMYCCRVSDQYGNSSTIYFRVHILPDRTVNLHLRYGLYLSIPDIDAAGAFIEVMSLDKLGNGRGRYERAIYAQSEIIYALFQNERIKYVVDVAENNIIKMPSQLSRLEEYALQDDVNVQYVEFDEAATTIYANAFKGTGLCQLLVKSSETVIEGQFENKANLVIICRDNSIAEQYAIDNNISYVTLIRDTDT